MAINYEHEEYLNSFPLGYRFNPTDEELVKYYLMNKNSNNPMPINRIIDINIYHFSPQQLSEMYQRKGEKHMYFFTTRQRKYPNGTRPSRAAGNGFWKATSADNIIGDEHNPIAFKKPLVYFEGKPKSAIKTNWIMQEYIVNTNKATSSTGRSGAARLDMKLDDWALCKIYLNKYDDNNPQENDSQVTPEMFCETSTTVGLSNSLSSPMVNGMSALSVPMVYERSMDLGFSSPSSMIYPIVYDPTPLSVQYSTSMVCERSLDTGFSFPSSSFPVVYDTSALPIMQTVPEMLPFPEYNFSLPSYEFQYDQQYPEYMRRPQLLD